MLITLIWVFWFLGFELSKLSFNHFATQHKALVFHTFSLGISAFFSQWFKTIFNIYFTANMPSIAWFSNLWKWFKIIHKEYRINFESNTCSQRKKEHILRGSSALFSRLQFFIPFPRKPLLSLPGGIVKHPSLIDSTFMWYKWASTLTQP